MSDELISSAVGRPADDVTLSCDDLQLNKHPSDEAAVTRSPSSVAMLPSQALVVVGFDSGEVQCYSMPGAGGKNYYNYFTRKNQTVKMIRRGWWV